MSSPLFDDITTGSSGMVPANQRHMKRFPIVFLVDRSGSTGVGGADADIHGINVMINDIMRVLQNPPPGDLRDNADQLDISVMSYGSDVTIDVDWSLAENLPTDLHWTADGGTATGAAFKCSLAHIANRLRYYADPANQIPSGMPNIFHTTDGEPSDMTLGTPLWNEVQGHLARLDGTLNPEAAKVKVIHFVAPNGCRITPHSAHVDEHGNRLSGQDVLARLSGPKSVYELTQGAESLPDLVKLITVVITNITSIAGAKAEDAAAGFAKSSTTIGQTTAPSATDPVHTSAHQAAVVGSSTTNTINTSPAVPL